MWFSKKQPVEDTGTVAVAEPSAKLSIPERRPAVPDMDATERDEYTRVATELGLADMPGLVNEQLRVVLKEENIHIYDREKVVAYLDQELGKGNWEWSGVGQRDVDRMDDLNEIMDDGQSIPFGDRRYRGEVPLPVLLTIKKIRARMPDVYFFVSERVKGDGDPFLMVTDRDISSYIVERWDEPSFRG